MKFRIILSFAVALEILASSARAEIKPAALFTDHAVLQRDAIVPVWGWAEPGEHVAVSFGDQKRESQADAQGAWRVDLAPMQASTSPREMTITGKSDAVTVKDLLVGEVWVCSGQSNMTFALNRAKDAEREIAAAAEPRMRLFDVPKKPSATPATDVGTHWTLCTPETANTFSAVAYFFGRQLAHELDVPIGVIHSSLGGTVAQNWSPRKVLQDPRFSKVLDRDRERVEKLPAATKAYEEALHHWETLPPAEKASAKKPTPPGAEAQKGGPGHLYNGMIAPLIPYSVRGVLWFQGESNRKDPNHYRLLLPEMIRGWRTAWGQPKLPFVMIQIANYMPPEGESGNRSEWAEIREVQRLTAESVGDASLVVTIDLGETHNLHPLDKQDVGKRASLQALRSVYGKPVVASGPTLKAVRFDGGKAILTFDNIGGGLTGRGDTLRGFTIAGSDHKFVPADAHLENDSVVVRSDGVPKPVAVRYAWSADPKASLYNAEGLPAGPFRTDDWAWGGPTSMPVVDP